MTNANREGVEQRVLVLAPTSKDADLSRLVLQRAGMTCHCCADLAEVCRELKVGAGAVLLAEEAVGPIHNACLDEWLAGQPPWSDLPILVLARPGADSAAVAQSMDLLGNVTVLERPTRVAALVSAVRSALRARGRQYELREHIIERERELQAKAILAAIVASSDDAIISKSLDGIIRSWNAGAERIFGYSASEAIGQPITLLIPPDRLEEEASILARLRAGERIEHFETVRVAKDGRHIDISLAVSPVRDVAGIISGASKVARDITELKRARQSLAASEQRFRSIFQNAGVSLWEEDFSGVMAAVDGLRTQGVTDFDRFFREHPDFVRQAMGAIRVVDVNDATVRMFEAKDKRELLGSLPKIFVSESIHVFQGELLAVAEGRTYFESEARLNTVQGNPVHVFFTMVLPGPGQPYDRVLFSVLDINALKRAEDALRESEERFRMLADNMSQLAWTCDKLGNVTWYNQRWLDYTGLSFEEIRDWGWKKVHHPDHVDRVVESVTRSRESGEVWEDTFPLRSKDGEYHWFLSRAVPIRNEAGKILRWFGTNTDVTERIMMEEALRDGDRRKDEFLAVLAHELRNPLAPIRNSLDILRMTVQHDPVVERVSEMMERQVNHMVRLVDDLMEVSRITRGKIELRKGPIEVAAIVRSAVETSRPLIDAAGHNLALSIPLEPLIVEGDSVRLAQVLANLLNNAAKYTEPGGQIWLTVRREADEVAISVRDTGTGIPAELLPRVFELFMQVERNANRAQGGLGIGLALVKSLVELHGGSVMAHSAGTGQGCEFVVRLPLSAGRLTTDLPGKEAGPSENPAPRRVLVVDDNYDAANSLGMLLKLIGVDVHIVHNGPDALEAFATWKPAVVLLDIGMPGMDGYEVARRIRREPQSEHVTLIALTGWGQKGDRDRSRTAGFDHHLTKPPEFGTLKTLLLSLEGHRRSSDS